MWQFRVNFQGSSVSMIETLRKPKRLICGIDLFDTAAAVSAFCLLISAYDRAHQLVLLAFCVIALLSTN